MMTTLAPTRTTQNSSQSREISNDEFTLFVPGRLALCGEHSDWAGGFRTANPKIHPGIAVVVGTQEGIFAKCAVTQYSTLKLSTFRRHTKEPLKLSIKMGSALTFESLLTHARDPKQYWSYGCGVALMVITRFDLTKPSQRGLSIDIIEEHSNLPVGKGLSSSAAICVLVARAFNRAFSLGLSLDGEMELAYSGERITGSLCGRMDQAVAFGSGSTGVLTFDGDFVLSRKVIPPTTPIYMVFADLQASKDTKIILSALQHAYPYPRDERDQKLHDTLGVLNQEICSEAIVSIESGDAKTLGDVMNRAQKLFDEAAMPLCPEQLTSPRLHQVLASPLISGLIYGGKGVGSQGDGTVQIVARGAHEAQEIKRILTDGLNCASCHILTIGGARPQPETIAASPHEMKDKIGTFISVVPINVMVTTAVITAAGFGTRLFPASFAVRPKPFMPIVDPIDGRAKPLLLALVEECLLRCGFESIVVVVGPGEEYERTNEFFQGGSEDLIAKLNPETRAYSDLIRKLGKKVQLIIQERPEGFGHAVFQAHEIVQDRPFALLLGDIIFQSESKKDISCLAQAVRTFEMNEARKSVLGLQLVPLELVSMYGTARTKLSREHVGFDPKYPVLEIEEFVEKPTKEFAKANLRAPGYEEDRYLITLGPYIFTSQLMKILSRHVEERILLSGEIQLTPAIDEMRGVEGLLGLPLRGEGLDIGVPKEFVRTIGRLSVDL